MSIEDVIDKYIVHGEPEAHIEDPHERVLAVPDRDDVTANNGNTDLLVGDVLDSHDEYGL